MAVKIAVIAGSVRDGSYNRTLARIVAARVSALGAETTEIDLAAFDLPIYADALEAKAFPPGALELKRLLQVQDALIVVSPEHNGSIPALLKNAIDWASRPTDGESLIAFSAFRGKAAAILSASISPFGGLRGLAHLRQILTTVQMLVIPDQVTVPFAGSAFDETGALSDPMPAMLVDTLAARIVAVGSALAKPA